MITAAFTRLFLTAIDPVVTPAVARICSRHCAAVTGMLLVATCLVVMPVTIGKAQAESQQTGWVGDLPIMEGMVIEPELGFAFDSPGGRIVLVFAATGEGQDGVLSFYNNALASLGWVGGDGSWQRGEESLTLAQVDTSVGRLWRIRLSPN